MNQAPLPKELLFPMLISNLNTLIILTWEYHKPYRINVRFEVTGFYTLFRNAIASAPFKLNGQDSIIYNGVKAAVYASQNVNKAYVHGINARLKIEFGKKVSWDNTISQTYGRYKNPDGTKKPLDHVPPVFGKSSVTYTDKKFSTEVYGMFNGWKKIKDYNPDGEDNGQYATARWNAFLVYH